MSNVLIEYNKEEDILVIHKGFKPDEKFKGNIDLGYVVFDLSTNGRIVGVELMDASKFFKNMGFKESFLEKISDAHIKSQINPGSLVVFLMLKAGAEEMRIPIPAPLK